MKTFQPSKGSKIKGFWTVADARRVFDMLRNVAFAIHTPDGLEGHTFGELMDGPLFRKGWQGNTRSRTGLEEVMLRAGLKMDAEWAFFANTDHMPSQFKNTKFRGSTWRFAAKFYPGAVIGGSARFCGHHYKPVGFKRKPLQ